jgi:hypothetical protein
MIVMELKRRTDLQPVGFLSAALALSFLALKEFSDMEYEGGVRITKNATLRMQRMLWWGALSVAAGGITKDAIEVGKWFWECFVKLLRGIKEIPSPIFSLLVQTAERPPSDWRIASNHILKWIVFGDRTKVLSALRRIRDAATYEASKRPHARRVLDVISFLLSDTDHLEPTLGMRAALER